MSKFATRVIFAMVLVVTGVALAPPARAVQLDPGGQGQVLLYPYFTVHDHQQTLLSIINTSDADQVVQVTFREALNGRSALQFKIWLGRKDTWTGTLFALADGNIASDGAALLTRDRTCTTPSFSMSGFGIGDAPYFPFSNDNYSGANSDGGPSDLGRARHGWIEVIALANLYGPPATAMTFASNGMPASCGFLLNPVIDQTNSGRPSGGLAGAVSVIRVAAGTILSSRAEALSGFTEIGLYNDLNQPAADLASVNEGIIGGAVSAKIVDDQGRRQVLTYGTPGSDSRPIDAVSAALMATRVKNEYQTDAALAASTDWVVTMPTKPFYTDPAIIGAGAPALPPFIEAFSAPGYSRLCSIPQVFNQDQRSGTDNRCTFMPMFNNYPQRFLILFQAANVIPFLNVTVTPISSVVSAPQPAGSMGAPVSTGFSLPWNVRPNLGPAGWMDLLIYSRNLPTSVEGKVLFGFPAIGYSASNLINGNVSNGVLANYAYAVRHVTTVACSKASDASPCD